MHWKSNANELKQMKLKGEREIKSVPHIFSLRGDCLNTEKICWACIVLVALYRIVCFVKNLKKLSTNKDKEHVFYALKSVATRAAVVARR